MKVKTDFVLEGAVRAACNAKRFMEDAILLYGAERYGSAYIIGVLAIENVGRGRWMLQQIMEATIDEKTKQFGVKTEIEGKTFSDNIRSDHETTIRMGTMSLQFAPESDVDMSEFDKWFKEIQLHPQGSPEQQEAIKNLRRAGRKVVNKTTSGFHAMRSIEQYVAPNANCTSWNEPQSATRQQVHDLIVDAGNNHRIFLAEMKGNDQLTAILLARGMMGDLEEMPLPLFTK